MIHIRPAVPSEAGILTRIAISSKRYWDYSGHWMELQLAFAHFKKKNGNAWIENLWIFPEFIGKGIGKRLFHHAQSRSRVKGHLTLQLEADPNAVAFMRKWGCIRSVKENLRLKDNREYCRSWR